MRNAVAALAALGMMAIWTAEAHALRFVVDSTVDAPDASAGDGVCLSTAGGCTLRAAFQQANDLTFRVDVIEIPAGTYPLTGTGGGGAPLGRLTSDRRSGPLEIRGAGPTETIIVGPGAASGQAAFLFASDTKISGVTIREGGAAGVQLGTPVADGGFTMIDCIVEDNANDSGGGGITSSGTLGPATFVRTLFRNNTSDQDGGALRLSTTRVEIRRSTFTGNTAGGRGGAISSTTPTMIENATIVGNTAGNDGGGLHASMSDVTILNTTIARNTATNQISMNGFGTSPTVQNSIVEGSCGTTIGGGAVIS
ncbi:MAG: right-handed parallel beta-helix repeat-containing protein, partial [Myxococcales bacterium]|nr:right-handed parallel beta-helix repeat-containing protein [Myxococcales bacterium]